MAEKDFVVFDCDFVSLITDDYKPINPHAAVRTYKGFYPHSTPHEEDTMVDVKTLDARVKKGDLSKEQLRALFDAGLIEKAVYDEYLLRVNVDVGRVADTVSQPQKATEPDSKKGPGYTAQDFLSDLKTLFKGKPEEDDGDKTPPAPVPDLSGINKAIEAGFVKMHEAQQAVMDAQAGRIGNLESIVKAIGEKVDRIGKSSPKQQFSVGDASILDDKNVVKPIRKAFVKGMCERLKIDPSQPLPEEVRKAITTGGFAEGLSQTWADSFMREIVDHSGLLQLVTRVRMEGATHKIPKHRLNGRVGRYADESVLGTNMADTVVTDTGAVTLNVGDLKYARVTVSDKANALTIEGAAYLNKLADEIVTALSNEWEEVLVAGNTAGSTGFLLDTADGIQTVARGTGFGGQYYDIAVLDGAVADLTFPGYDAALKKLWRVFRMTKNLNRTIRFLQNREDYRWLCSQEVAEDIQQFFAEHGNETEKTLAQAGSFDTLRRFKIAPSQFITPDGSGYEWVGLVHLPNWHLGWFANEDWQIETTRVAPQHTILYFKFYGDMTNAYDEGINFTDNIQAA